MIPALVFMSNQEGQNIYANAQFQRYCGVPEAKLLNGGWLEIIHEEDRTRAEVTWKNSWAHSEPYDVRYRFRRFDGDYRWHVVRGTPLKNAEGQVVRWIGACTDVDDLLRSVTLRNDSEIILDNLTKMPGLCIYAKDDKGRFRFASESTIAVLNADRDRVIGATADSLTARSNEARDVQSNDDATIAMGKPCAFDEQWTDGQGFKRTFRSIKMPITLGEGEQGVLGVSIEAMPIETGTSQLSADISLLRAQIDALPIIAWVADELGNIISVNHAWHVASGCPTRNAVFDDVVAPENRRVFLKAWEYCIESGDILDMELVIVDKLNGGSRLARVIAVPTEYNVAGSASIRWIGTIEYHQS